MYSFFLFQYKVICRQEFITRTKFDKLHICQWIREDAKRASSDCCSWTCRGNPHIAASVLDPEEMDSQTTDHREYPPSSIYRHIFTKGNTGHSPNAVLMLAQRQRWWATIETALGGCLLFAGL